MSGQTRLVEVRQHILKHNDVVARALRERFRQALISPTRLPAPRAEPRRRHKAGA